MKHLTSLLLLSILPLIGACDDWRCGYGGPGCSDAVMYNICTKTLTTEQSHIIKISYSDDTSTVYPATIHSIRTTDALSATKLKEDGMIEIMGVKPGTGQLILTLEYWDTPQVYAFEVFEDKSKMPALQRDYFERCNERGLGLTQRTSDTMVDNDVCNDPNRMKYYPACQENTEISKP